MRPPEPQIPAGPGAEEHNELVTGTSDDETGPPPSAAPAPPAPAPPAPPPAAPPAVAPEVMDGIASLHERIDELHQLVAQRLAGGDPQTGEWLRNLSLAARGQ